MAYNGSGVFSRIYSWATDAANGLNISSTRMDAEMDGMATGLSTCITKDGQTTITANLPMAGFKHTGVGNASARNHYAAVGQVQDGAFVWGGTAGGTANAITISTSPVTTADAAGQAFRFVSSAANTGAATLNVNSLGTKDITKLGAVALGAGDIANGSVVDVVYDGTQFQLRNPAQTGKFKTGNFTRDVTTASGTQSITGVGFKPKSLIINGGPNGTAAVSWGVTDGTNSGCTYDNSGASAGTYGVSTTNSIIIAQSGSNVYTGTISFDADGFTVTWVKTGTPTGTATFNYTAFR